MSETLIVSLPTGRLRVDVESVFGKALDFIDFAARANAKRPFLFLSTVLGKHYPVRPSRMQAVHGLLADQVPIRAGPVVFIGMAETATGLGQGVFEAWQHLNPGLAAMFIQTTRYRVAGTEPLIFEESHSHAPTIFLNLPSDKALLNLFQCARAVVLVDDEISTGNTLINLTAVLRRVMPNLAHVHIATSSYFLGRKRHHEFLRVMSLPCTVGAALTGQWAFEHANIPYAPPNAQRTLGHEACLVDRGYGRLGRPHPLVLSSRFVKVLAERVKGQSTLVLGTGEFMHPAFVLGRALEERGCDVRVQATTRSPILRGGAVSSVLHVADIYGEGLPNYLYNVRLGQYDNVLICHETCRDDAVTSLARQLDGSLISFQHGDHVHDDPVRRPR